MARTFLPTEQDSAEIIKAFITKRQKKIADAFEMIKKRDQRNREDLELMKRRTERCEEDAKSIERWKQQISRAEALLEQKG